MANSRKKILITGACGLIGRELCNQLTDSHWVTAVDNNWKYSDYTPACSEFYSMTTDEYVKNNINDFDLIYHMGAINGTKYFYSIPNQLIQNNICNDLAIFNFAETNPNCKLIYASSSEVVADSTNIPVAEETNIYINNLHNPRWSYRLSKMVGENYLVNSNINYVIFRIFNTYSEYSASGHMLRDIIDKILNGNFELLNPGDTRSFCYVADMVAAMIVVADQADRDIINIGNDEELTVKQSANIIASILNISSPPWVESSGHQGSTSRRCPNLSKLRSYIPNYKPENLSMVLNKIKSKLLTRPK